MSMSNRLLVPAIALLGLAGCTGYSPPPRAVLNCINSDPIGGDFEYLQCLKEQQVGQAAPSAGPIAPAGPVASVAPTMR